MARRLKRLDDAAQHLKDRTPFTSGLRKTPYGEFVSMSGEVHDGGPRLHGMWSFLPREYHNSVAHATYVVYSYETPMAWWLESPEPGASMETVELWLAGGQVGFWVMPSVDYSPTTSQHQSLIAEAIDPFHERDEDGNVRWHEDDLVRRTWTTEYRLHGWPAKHKYKNRGEHRDGPSVERTIY